MPLSNDKDINQLLELKNNNNKKKHHLITSRHGYNTGPLLGESSNHYWPFPPNTDWFTTQRVNKADIWFVPWNQPEQTPKQRVELLVMWYTMSCDVTVLYCLLWAQPAHVITWFKINQYRWYHSSDQGETQLIQSFIRKRHASWVNYGVFVLCILMKLIVLLKIWNDTSCGRKWTSSYSFKCIFDHVIMKL